MFWLSVSQFLIRYRIYLSILLVLFTALLTYEGSHIEMSYEYAKIIPEGDSTMRQYRAFTRDFGEDANALIIGFNSPYIRKADGFRKFSGLCDKLLKIRGISNVLAIPTTKIPVKNPVEKKFDFKEIGQSLHYSQSEVDSVWNVFDRVAFYRDRLYNDRSGATVMAVYIQDDFLNSPKRKQLIESVIKEANAFGTELGTEMYFGGLPYVRYINVGKFRTEFQYLTLLSSLVTCLILWLIFRSWYAVVFTLAVVVVTVLWSTGFTVLLGYKISFLTGMIPALIVIISIPNCVYMLNKYHQEYRKHGNKVKAVSRIIEKVGFITFLTNINTAVGFFVLVQSDTTLISEFGMLAGIMSTAAFLITLSVVPALFLWLPDPDIKHIHRLDYKPVNKWLERTAFIVFHQRKAVYLFTVVLTVLSVWGITRVESVSYMVDDFPEEGTNIKKSLTFFEQQFGGVMPLEIVVSAKQKKGITKPAVLQKMAMLEDSLAKLSGLSKPVSIVQLLKASTQAFYLYDSGSYRLPTGQERTFIGLYLKKSNKNGAIDTRILDSTQSKARISIRVADMGTSQMSQLLEKKIRPAIREIFSGTGLDVSITGMSVLFLEGNDFLVKDLTSSLLWALLLISLMMLFVYTDVRIIFISLIPNLLPLLITLGIMGWCGIRLKTSTAVIFSTSFGITIDSTIHFLSRFKQEMQTNKISALQAVCNCIKETGSSILYTSGILIAGFGIFMFSGFGQTVALGLLTCITLFTATFANLFLLPALLADGVKTKEQSN